MREIKYIIAKKYGKLCHRKSTWLSHDTIARDNGFDSYSQVIETGLLICGRVIILECKDINHRQKRINKTSIDKQLLRAREVESLYSYRYAGLREGD
jgi:hypothetical protein